MWFKQIQLFKLPETFRFKPEILTKQLQPFEYQPCLPSLPFTLGWVSPVQEKDSPLIQEINGYVMLCLQFEEKILPAAVIRQELIEKIKKIEAETGRKIRAKEKLSLKDDVIHSLLPRAFSKLIRIYAYIDTKNRWLVLGSSNTKKIEQFVSFFKKSTGEELKTLQSKKTSAIMTQWLKNTNMPTSFVVEKNCVLGHPEQKNRMIRCQQQDLFSKGVQAFLKEGFEVKLLALSWKEQLNFQIFADEFSLRNIQFKDELLSEAEELEAETPQQQFHADFYIMTETLTALLLELQNIFIESAKKINPVRTEGIVRMVV